MNNQEPGSLALAAAIDNLVEWTGPVRVAVLLDVNPFTFSGAEGKHQDHASHDLPRPLQFGGGWWWSLRHSPVVNFGDCACEPLFFVPSHENRVFPAPLSKGRSEKRGHRTSSCCSSSSSSSSSSGVATIVCAIHPSRTRTASLGRSSRFVFRHAVGGFTLS